MTTVHNRLNRATLISLSVSRITELIHYSAAVAAPFVGAFDFVSMTRKEHDMPAMLNNRDSVTIPVETGGEPSFETLANSKSRKIPWSVQLKTFCSEASVVGLRYVANPSASVFRRSIWVLLLLVGAAFTTYQILDRTKYYFSYPTNVNIRVEHVAEMRFPSVTFCNENVITLSGATTLGMSRMCHHCCCTV